jgi:hypothetical protein
VQPAIAADAASLRADIAALFRSPAAERDDARFAELARRSFRFQFEHNRPYRAYCERRGRTPATVDDWREVPAVPSAAFKEVDLVAGDAASAQAVFRTSGTTRGRERRGRHLVLDLSLYHASATACFEAFVVPDAVPLRMLSLMPPARELPDSSLAHMISLLLARLGAAGSGTFADAAGGIDENGLDRALRAAESDGAPVCLLGTTLAFVHWLEALRRRGLHYRLPAGSRLMDTGGYKGAEREVPAAEVRRAYGERLGLDPWTCVNEYGMTEMCSQLYDTALRDRVLGAPPGPDGRKAAPAWVGTGVVDPVSLEAVAAGDAGLVRHFDLANLFSVGAIQTEDRAVEVDGGLVLLGRERGAPPRGCSIAMDDLLRAVGRGPR